MKIGTIRNGSRKKPVVVSRTTCPRCACDTSIKLDKAEPTGNTCYRCTACGYIFSPRSV